MMKDFDRLVRLPAPSDHQAPGHCSMITHVNRTGTTCVVLESGALFAAVSLCCTGTTPGIHAFSDRQCSGLPDRYGQSRGSESIFTVPGDTTDPAGAAGTV